MASMRSASECFESFVVDGVAQGDVDADGVVRVSPFVRALMQSKKLHRWATPSVIPDLCLPNALDGEYSISVEAFGSHLDNTGLLGDVAKRVTKLLGGDDGYFTTSGTTTSNHKVMLTHATRFPGAPLIACRNVHHSITHSASLYGVSITFAKPGGYIEEFEAVLPPTAADIEEALRAHPDAKIVLITSPTYEGVIADVAAIAEVVHGHGALLWVDQAWGSHLGAGPAVPASSISLGADIMCTSTHKTGGALQGAGVLAFRRCSRLIDSQFELALRDAHVELETTSPNFEIIASIDAAACRLFTDAKLMDTVVQTTRELRDHLTDTFGDRLLCLEANHPALLSNHLRLDPVRLSVSLCGAAVGHHVAAFLERHGVVAEKAGLRTLLFIATFQLPATAIDRVGRLLRRYFAEESSVEPSAAPAAPEWLLNVGDTAAQGSDGPTLPRIVAAEAAVGLVANETVECYPPGIPVIVPGHVITLSHLAYLREMKSAGAHIVAADKTLQTFRVRLPKAA